MAARLLGIGRTSLYRYMKTLDRREQESTTIIDFKTIDNNAHHETGEIDNPAWSVSANRKLVSSLTCALMCDQM